MSGETESNVSGWTVDTLLSHFERIMAERDLRYEQRFIAQERASQLALNAQKEATATAEVAAQRWRDAANEWRAAMTDRERHFMPRNEAEQIVLTNTERIHATNNTMEARMASLIAAMDKIEKRIDINTGRSAGLSASWGYLVGAVAIAGAVIGVVIGVR